MSVAEEAPRVWDRDCVSAELPHAGIAHTAEGRLESGAASKAFCGYDVAAMLLFAVLVGLAVVTFKDYAVSNDEGVQHHYGELILSYYASGFADQSLFRFDNLYLYGGLFDIVAVLLSRHLPMDPYDLRHILCALIGISGVGFAWATARLIAGPRAALIAASALAVCGSWYGGMFNHTKDIPLATAMAGAVFFLVLVSRELPRPKTGHVLCFGLLTGAALGIKVLGLLLVVYAALVVLVQLPRPFFSAPQAGLRYLRTSTGALLPALLIAYVIMIAAWPWSGLAPLNPIRGLISFADFHYHIQTILDGQRYEMATSPRSYVPIYIAIKVPLLTTLGALVAVAFLALPVELAEGRRKSGETALIAFCALFPLICQFVGHGPAFTGMRHFLFVVPMLSILAGVGIDTMLSRLSFWRPIAASAAVVVGAVIAWNAATLIRLHPYEYLSYNALVGGLPGASRRYAMDYWVNIMPEAVESLKAYLDRKNGSSGARDQDSYTIGICGERVSFEREKEVEQVTQLQWTADWQRADFFIAPTHMNCDGVLAGTIVTKIERQGVLIGVVKDRRAITRPMVGDAGHIAPK